MIKKLHNNHLYNQLAWENSPSNIQGYLESLNIDLAFWAVRKTGTSQEDTVISLLCSSISSKLQFKTGLSPRSILKLLVFYVISLFRAQVISWHEGLDCSFKYSGTWLDFEWTVTFCLFGDENSELTYTWFWNKTGTNVCQDKGHLNLRFRKDLLSTNKGATQSYTVPDTFTLLSILIMSKMALASLLL